MANYVRESGNYVFEGGLHMIRPQSLPGPLGLDEVPNFAPPSAVTFIRDELDILLATQIVRVGPAAGLFGMAQLPAAPAVKKAAAKKSAKKVVKKKRVAVAGKVKKEVAGKSKKKAPVKKQGVGKKAPVVKKMIKKKAAKKVAPAKATSTKRPSKKR